MVAEVKKKITEMQVSLGSKGSWGKKILFRFPPLSLVLRFEFIKNTDEHTRTKHRHRQTDHPHTHTHTLIMNFRMLLKEIEK